MVPPLFAVPSRAAALTGSLALALKPTPDIGGHRPVLVIGYHPDFLPAAQGSSPNRTLRGSFTNYPLAVAVPGSTLSPSTRCALDIVSDYGIEKLIRPVPQSMDP